MKKLLVGFLALSLANFCNAQTVDKKEEVKFAPPGIKKDKQTTKSKSTTKFAPPIIKKGEEVKFASPVFKKIRLQKSEKVKFKPPVLVNDKSLK